MGIANTISLLGGLGFFLFGMSLLGDGLKRVAGSKLETILARLTSTTFRGVLLGTLVTAVIQSSSATTVMVVGFVNSGIMKLTNAIGIIMGANIGTTATGWLLVLAGVDGGGAFSSATMFALVAFIGIILFFFFHSSAKKNVGLIMLAFAVLMNGMQSMSAAMSPLKENETFLNFISAVSNPLISVAVGVVVTAVIQSSSASIGILQALSVTGVISYEVAIPMVLGMCIGACAPVLLSAIGANVNGKRTAFIYLYFNLVGTLILMVPFYVVNAVVGLEFMDSAATSMGIAVANTVYKVLATLLLMPFAGLIEKLACITVPDKQNSEDEVDIGEPVLLDERFLDHPAVALVQAEETVKIMTAAAFKNLDRSIELLERFSQEKYDKIMLREDKVDRFEDATGEYLIKLNAKELNERQTRDTGRFLGSISNIERVSDHAVNIAELAQDFHAKRFEFSEDAKKELGVCISALLELAGLTRDAIDENDTYKARQVEPLEDVIDALTTELKQRHISRLQAGQCTFELGIIFNDLLNNFERVADHCSNLAMDVLEGEETHIRSHAYIQSLRQSNQKDYIWQLNSSAQKYYDALSNI